MRYPLDKHLTARNKLTVEKHLFDWGKRKRKINNGYGVLLEGEKLVSEAMERRMEFKCFCVTVDFFQKKRSLFNKLRQHCTIYDLVTEQLMKKLSEQDTPSGVIAVASEPSFNYLKPEQEFSLILSMHTVQDPGNLGTVIRTADFFGVNEIWLSADSADPFAPKVIRGSMGSVFQIPVFRGDVVTRISEFKKHGATVWASVVNEAADNQVVTEGNKRILMLGSESKGLSKALIMLADQKVSIPRAGKAESLNLSVATGIMIYEAMK